MAESNTTYERRDGTDCDHGINFEWQTTNLAYLRCEKLNRQWVQDNTSGVKSYFIANNVDGIGAFDDVVIRVKYPHQNVDKTKLIFVQCKHFINPKKVLLDKLVNRATMQKYFDSFIEVLRILNDHRAITCQTYKEIEIRMKTKRQRTHEMDTNTEKEKKLRNLFQCKPQDCEFILYSNIILEAGFENTQTQQDNDISIKILNTARSDKFNILLNAMQLEFLSNEQLVDAREMFLELKQEFAAKFRIIVNQVESVNSDVLKSIKPTSDIESISPLLDEEIKSMFQTKPCNVITQNSQLLEIIENFCKLKTLAKNEMDSFLHISKYRQIFSNESMESLQKHFKNERKTKIYTSCIELEKLKLKQFVNSEVQGSKLLVFIKDEAFFSIWTKARKSRLYRNINQIFVCFEDLNKYSDYDKDDKEVLIEVYQNNDTKTTLVFAQFSDELLKSIINHTISFQGSIVKIKDICGDECYRCLDGETICRILRREEITIGRIFADPLYCYIERKLQFKEFDNQNIEIETKKLESTILTENEIIAIENKEILLISGPAGMGKSTTLKSLAIKYKSKNPTYFVYYIELNKYMNVLKKYKQESDISRSIDFLARNILGTQELEYRLFFYALTERKNVALFFDAFDEISPDGEEKFSSFLKNLLEAHISRIFVSSRPNFIVTLEKNITRDSLIFLPFTLEDKKLLFLRYYEKSTKKNATTNDKKEMENVISQIIKSMDENEEAEGKSDHLLSIPLHITMLAEIHFDNCIEMTAYQKLSFTLKMDICSLYNYFIQKLIERYLIEKRNLIMLDEEMNIEIRDKMKDAEELACKLLCPDINQTPLSEYSDAIVKMCNQIGLITNIDPPVFLHRTYGEFLAANWFVQCIVKENKNTSSNVSFLCNKVLLEDFGIRRFINAILFKFHSGENDSHIVNPNVKISSFFDEEIDSTTSLHLAIIEKHMEILKLLLKNNPSKINTMDFNGNTALHQACISCNYEAVEFLVSNHCLLNIEDRKGNSALHHAAESCNADIIHLILEKDPTLLRKKNMYGSTAFILACEYNTIEVMMCFLKFDIGLVEIAKKDGNLPLHYATKHGNIQMVKENLCHNSNLIDHKRNDGLLPLHIACKHDHVEVAKYLLSQKTSLVSVGCGKLERTPLHFAAINGNIELMKILLHHDTTLLNKCDLDGESPLFCTLYHNKTEAATFLLTFPNCVLSKGENPLTRAARNGNIEIMTLLLQHDKELLNKCNSNQESPFLCALLEEQSEAAKFLLTFPNCVVNKGENPLNLAAKIGDVEILRKIYSLDCTVLNKVGEKYFKGCTPLLCAMKKQNIEAVKFLLQLPECLLTLDLDEISPFNYAAVYNNLEFMNLLLNKDRSLLLKQDINGRSALYYAIDRGHNDVAFTLLSCDEYFVEGNIQQNEVERGIKTQNFEIMTLLLERNPTLINMGKSAEMLPLEIACKSNNTEAVKYLLPRTDSSRIWKVKRNRCILHYAVAEQNLIMIKLILEKFPTLLNQRDTSGYTPLHYACMSNSDNTEVVELLLKQGYCHIDVYSDDLNNPLHIASEYRNKNIMKIIYERNKTFLNIQNKNGRTPLHMAVYVDDYQTDDEIDSSASLLLLSWNCLANVEDMYGYTPIHLAVLHNVEETIKDSIERDRTLLNQRDWKGRTLLHRACKQGKIETMRVLLNFPDCDITLTDYKGNTTLHHAAMNYFDFYDDGVEKVSLLVQRDRSLLTVINYMGRTALHSAAAYGNGRTLQFLLGHVECKANVQDLVGDTPLHRCIQRYKEMNHEFQNKTTLWFFAQYDSSLLNIKNDDGQTPLHIAVTMNTCEAVELLVLFGADVHIKDNNNCTPLDLALELKKDEKNRFDENIIDILQKKTSDNSNN